MAKLLIFDPLDPGSMPSVAFFQEPYSAVPVGYFLVDGEVQQWTESLTKPQAIGFLIQLEDLYSLDEDTSGWILQRIEESSLTEGEAFQEYEDTPLDNSHLFEDGVEEEEEDEDEE